MSQAAAFAVDSVEISVLFWGIKMHLMMGK